MCVTVRRKDKHKQILKRVHRSPKRVFFFFVLNKIETFLRMLRLCTFLYLKVPLYFQRTALSLTAQDVFSFRKKTQMFIIFRRVFMYKY